MPPNVHSNLTIPDANEWLTLNKQVNGYSGFYPLTIKAGYVIGTMYLIASSIWCLSEHPEGKEITYIPRYLLIATCIELLGRSVSGQAGKKEQTLLEGLRWIFNKPVKQSQKDKEEVVITAMGKYSIRDLNYMRHFAAHGQATTSEDEDKNNKPIASKFEEPDEELLTTLLDKLGEALETYWYQLQHDRDKCERLRDATIKPVNSKRVFLAWKLFQDRRFVQGIFNEILSGEIRLFMTDHTTDS